MKTQTIIPQSKRTLLGRRIAAKEARGWKLYATGIGMPTLGGKSHLQKAITAAERSGLEADYVLGAREGILYNWAVIVKTQGLKQDNTPNTGDMLFIYSDKQGRKVPIFARTVEEADRRAEDAGLSDLSDFRAYALADVTGLLQ